MENMIDNTGETLHEAGGVPELPEPAFWLSEGMANAFEEAGNGANETVPMFGQHQLRAYGEQCALAALAQAGQAAPAGEVASDQVLAICTAYEQGYGKGQHARKVANPYTAEWGCNEAWQLGYEEGADKAKQRATHIATTPGAMIICVRDGRVADMEVRDPIALLSDGDYPLYLTPATPTPTPSESEQTDSALPDGGAVDKDAARYRLLRRGQHWDVIDGIGHSLRAEQLDAAIDRAAASKTGGA